MSSANIYSPIVYISDISTADNIPGIKLLTYFSRQRSDNQSIRLNQIFQLTYLVNPFAFLWRREVEFATYELKYDS